MEEITFKLIIIIIIDTATTTATTTNSTVTGSDHKNHTREKILAGRRTERRVHGEQKGSKTLF